MRPSSARDGETLLALDGRIYTLDKNVCVIADDHGVESLAGIMGGEASGCSENTTDVLIESALWDEINIAQSGRKLGINSDARYRFERGVDPAFMLPGLEMATRLVMELCGGSPSENIVVGKAFGEDRVVDFPLTEVKRLAGIEVPMVEMKRILTHLGFMMAGQGPVVKVAVPSWRTDVHGKADIVEEIVRIVGVDKVPMTPFDRGDAPRKPILTAMQLRTRRAKRALAAIERRHRHLVDADDTHDLLDDIGLAMHVGTPGGHRDLHDRTGTGHHEAEMTQDTPGFRQRDVDAGETLDFRERKIDQAVIAEGVADDDILRRRAAAQLHDQPGRELQS